MSLAARKSLQALAKRVARTKRAHGHDHHHGHAHPYDHAHDHDHDHGHGHTHETLALPTRPDLPRGAGAGKVLFLDAPSGLAGDMIVAALVDLGVPERVIHEAVAGLPLGGFHLHFGTRVHSGIVATAFDVHVGEAQPERTWGEIRAMLRKSKLAKGVLKRALATFTRLAESEAKVHRMPIDDVHFHEVGAVDAIVDVVASAAALDWLGARVLVSPLPMGHGRVKARHGVLPLPPPAVVECLRGLPTYDGGIAFELVTPTGAAIVGAHAEGATRWPSLVPRATGWGAGTAVLPDRANVLRAVLGDDATTTSRAAAPTAAGSHVVLEANLDDATGELVAACIATLLEAGALDAWATPIAMKKGRPALTLSALATAERAEELAAVILRETPSLGVRWHEVRRLERPRRIEHVETPYGLVPVKVAEGPFGPPQRKPEFDACLALAREHGVPVREILKVALAAEPKRERPGRKAQAAESAKNRPKRAAT